MFAPPLWLSFPFIILLLALASLPIVTPHFWERWHRRIILGLSAVPIVFYAFVARDGGAYGRVAWEYASFMIVIGSLYVVSGGLVLRRPGEASPLGNVAFLLCGALCGNIIGTTGASMLLIRPWIRSNKYRYSGYHTAFFIFVVSNVGGALTPLGPPLFMGYLKGVPFWWGVQHYILPWMVTLGWILIVFYLWDRYNFGRVPAEVRERMAARGKWRVQGWGQLTFVVAILAAIIWAPEGYRELTMVVAGVFSYFTSAKAVHEANHFNFGPMKEVGWIFIGIFATMKPVIDFLVTHADGLGIQSASAFYWLSGLLSGFLDNAPTYLTFLAAAFGLHHLNVDNLADMRNFLSHDGNLLAAISLGSTSFGALTYLGNAPNLMVKAIGDHLGVKTPHFGEYLARYSLPVLIPIFLIISWWFF